MTFTAWLDCAPLDAELKHAALRIARHRFRPPAITSLAELKAWCGSNLHPKEARRVIPACGGLWAAYLRAHGVQAAA
jgi:hypothetical protein